MRSHAVVESPLGVLTVVAQDGALAALVLPEQRSRPAAESLGPRDDAVLPGLREQLTAYFARDLQTLEVELVPTGTPFQEIGRAHV